MSKRAALCARVSDDEQVKGFSIPTQLAKMRQYAELHGFTVVAEFTEDYTATKLARPELDKIRTLARRGEIDALIVYSSDRLTRDRIHGPLLRAELHELGVELHYAIRGKVEYTPEGELFASIEDNFNAYWREKMLEAATRGRRGKAEAGIIPGQGSLPYGYTKDGKHRDMHLVIVEEQAQIIRDIYRWFVIDDMGAFDIAKRLTALGIPTPGGAHHANRKAGLCDWHGNMITKILRKDVYAGTFYAYKYYTPKGTKTCRLRPRSEWVPIPVPAIVERDVWEAAQKKLDETRRKYITPPKHEYLMSRRIKCACGKYVSARPHTVSGKTYLYYDCNAAFKNIRAYRCSLPSFRAEQVDAVVWEWVHRLLLDPRAMIAGYKASQHTYDEQNKRVHEQIAVIDRHIEKQQQQLAQVLDLYLEGDFTKAVLEHKRGELEAQLAALRDERQQLTDRIAQTTLTDEHIVSITELAAIVRDELDTADFALRRQLVEALNISCTLAVEDGEKVVYVHWYTRKDRLYTVSEVAHSPA